jgi:hypothetical protein
MSTSLITDGDLLFMVLMKLTRQILEKLSWIFQPFGAQKNIFVIKNKRSLTVNKPFDTEKTVI